jgi:uncharacterized protein YndB with AHSA1/START domain
MSAQAIYATDIATTPEQLWAALTHPELTQQYFLGRRLQSDWKIGSEFELVKENGRVESRGTVLDCKPPHRLSVTWHAARRALQPQQSDPIVTFELQRRGGLVRLTVDEFHTQPHEEEVLKRGGWPMILSSLKNLLETGRLPTNPR